MSVFNSCKRLLSSIHKHSPNSTIYVYHDYGTSEFCHMQLKNFATALNPDLNVKSITGDEVKENKWQKNAALLCIGGGFDRGYVKSIEAEGMKSIRDYVEKGGSYLGICAGAYFASKKVIFDEGGPDEVIEKRNLEFCDGNSIGPVFPGFRYESEEGSSAAVLRSTNSQIKPSIVTCYYNGGCSFEVEDSKICQILYRYEDSHKPAIVECHPGLGRAIVSGVHFEYDPVILEQHEKGEPTLKILNRLKMANDERLELGRVIFKFLISRAFDCREVYHSHH